MEKIKEFCLRWGVEELALFGSVLREDFGPESDIDVLVTFAPERRPTGLELVRMRRDLQEMFHRPVDVMSRRGVEQSHNPQLRQEILSTAEVIYAQAA
jgi:hypothetical protein